jgi:glyoxylase-like metal-dependent hydrolase (beta-lactamase superfamily II)
MSRVDSDAPGVLEFPPLAVPAPAAATTIAPGLLWIRHPVPGSLNHINLWLIDEGDRWTVVDTGMNLPETRALWETLSAGVMGGRPLGRLIVTHNHPDHFGLAQWLVDRHGCELWMSREEYDVVRRLTCEVEATYLARREGFYTMFGLARDDETDRMARAISFRAVLSGVPPPDRFLAHGDVLGLGGHAWRVIEQGGHADGQVLLHDAARGILISADQVLPRISSNVSVFPGRAPADPLSTYLDSLAELALLPEDTLVLPSHGRPFRGLAARVDELGRHHAAFLERFLSLCDQPLTPFELSLRLFPQRLDSTNRLLATSETLAHARYLWLRGRLLREQDGEGRDRYRRAA